MLLDRKRPETRAGGFARGDGTVTFYTRVNSLIEPHMTVLDLGAGRGSKLLGPSTFTSRLVRLQGKAKKVIGIDVDDAIKQHPFLDERHVIEVGAPYPLPDASVDLIVSEWVLEHITDPAPFAAEIERVLRPGGWFIGLTPSRWSYVAMGATIIPSSMHDAVIRKVWPERHVDDVFPTVYRLNTPGALKRYFSSDRWLHCSYATDGTPKYHANNWLLFTLFDLVHKLTPAALKTELVVLLQKR